MGAPMANTKKSQYYGAMQAMMDSLYRDDEAPYMALIDEDAAFKVSKLDAVLAAEAADLPDELLRIVNMLPPGKYTRQKLAYQLNSAINGHAWGQKYGTVE